jgi:Ca2+-binding RTX toxin-like protein
VTYSGGAIFVFDRQTNTTERVSVASSNSEESSISADGHFVTYQSAASNLVAGDTNATDDIFLFDRQTNTTTRLSAASDGTEGNAASFEPTISAVGHFVTYTSLASNLVPGGSNGTADIFVVQTPQPIDGVVEDGDERNILLNATDGTNERDVITGRPEMDIIFAGAGDDLVDGAQGNDLILGGERSDFLDAGDGDDIVDAGAGNDFVLAGTGDDGIAGGEGNDVIQGGEGNDGLDGQEGNADPMSTAYRVILEGSQEVPANASTASGVGTVIFDSAAVAASYSFDIQGLDFGPITSGQVPTDPIFTTRCEA